MIPIATLRERIELHRPVVDEENEFGETIVESRFVARVWAAVKQLAGGDVERNSATVSQRSYEITIRYRSDVAEKWQIKLGGRTLEITEVVEVEHRRWTQITSHEVRT